MKFNATLHGDKITVGGVDAFTPMDGDYTTFNYLGEDFDLTTNTFPYLEVKGSLGTIAKIETDNENGINYVKQYMRGMYGVESIKNCTRANLDYVKLLQPYNSIVGDFELEIDFILYFTDMTRTAILSNRSVYSATQSLYLFMTESKLSLTLGYGSGFLSWATNFALEYDTRYKIKLTRVGLTYDLYIDGVYQETIVAPVDYDTPIGNGLFLALAPILNDYSNSKYFSVRLNDKTWNLDNLINTADVECKTSHVDGQLYIDNEMHRAIGYGSPDLATLSADNIVFDNGATDSGALVEAVDYTDSTTEHYPLNEGEGDIAFGELGSRGDISNPMWAYVLDGATATYRMCMAMGMAIPFGAGK